MSVYSGLLEEQEQYARLKEAVLNKISPVRVTGTAESQKLHLAFSLCSSSGRGMVYVCADALTAKFAYEDLKFFAPPSQAYLFPAKELMFYDIEAKSSESAEQRMNVLSALVTSKNPLYIVTTVEALCQRTIDKDRYAESLTTLKVGDVYDISSISSKLVRLGYRREHETISPGMFSVRGGIIDVCPFSGGDAYRIEFFDDEIDSIRIFDMSSQLSVEKCESVVITPATEDGGGKKCCLADYAKESLFIIDEPHRCAEGYNALADELAECLEAAAEKGYSLAKENDKPEYYMEDYAAVIKKMTSSGAVGLSNLSMNTKGLVPKASFTVTSKSMPAYNGDVALLCDDLMFYLINKYRVILPCGTHTHAKSIAQDLGASNIPWKWEERDILPERGIVTLVPGNIRTGFEYPLTQSAFFCDRVLSGEVKKRKPLKKKGNIRSVNDISEGDFVVHRAHGIGVYEGIHQLTMDGITKDYLKIRYKGADMLYVPVNQLDVISKYVGGENSAKINKLGGNEWNNAKAKVQKSVEELAQGLIELYAKRECTPGYRYSPDTELQSEFENTFVYSETDDQIKAIEQVKGDMEKPRPMDRLLCGDVGYGKTEVAMRAAFKAVMDSKQVAYLVPTTLLAKQHYENFAQRMKDFPVKVDMLSRFRSKKEQEKTLEMLKKGTCDIVIGTHRLLQKDIKFKDLGLLIIDEEQRFGVTHKEKIKELKNNVDVLTLSATPIPRTLNMAMTGLRDMSILNEPPRDRHPVQTYVMEYNEDAVKNAIAREIARGGQVYYLYNRVEGIEGVAAKLKRMMPDVRFVTAHGKMNETELENVMSAVLEGEYDVLVCTTIIETGLDMPNMNTIIVEDADHFGLAQLYQLRGRVGRSSRLAYAYLMVRKNKMLDEAAEKRLKAIKEFTEFGSGIKIAMRDLEIRGAGSVLGARQHGHINQVGYDLYCRLLDSAVKQLKNNEEIKEEVPLTIDLAVNTFIPESYISDQLTRVDAYKTIAGIETQEEAYEVETELCDRFGELPKSVQNLVDSALIRNTARSLGITDITQKGANIVMKLSESTPMPVIIDFVGERRVSFYLNSGKSISLVYVPSKEEFKDICVSLKNVLKEIADMRGGVKV